MGEEEEPSFSACWGLKMKRATFLVTCVALASVSGHEYYAGKCPIFTPMKEFDWAQFSSGVWYVTQKFSTKSSCLTYEFETDDLGFKSVKQDRKLPFSDELGVDNKYIYKGKLYAPDESNPAKMIVRFPLNPVGDASFVVMSTDYSTFALLCTCQESSLFGLANFNRRSCSILQRSQKENDTITENLKKLLNDDLREEDPNNPSHDFDPIKQENCKYDKDKPLTIDVEKILGLATGSSKGSLSYEDVYGDYESDAEWVN